MNQTIAKLVRCQARRAEFGVLDQPSNGRTLGRKQNSSEADGLPLPPRCDLEKVGVLREQDSPKGRCPREQLLV